MLLSGILLLGACDGSRVFEENLEISKEGWNRSQKAKFEFRIEDINQKYNLYINLRNTTDYPYNNIWLFTNLKTEGGKYSKDTVQVLLSDNIGRWLGSGFGKVITNKVLYKRAIQFPQTGTYIFDIEQAMREEDLSGIIDVGFRVEKNTEPENSGSATGK